MNSPVGQVDLYGQDHSPWVQAVLLGLHEKGIRYSLTTAPPLPVFLNWGVLMPAARLDGGAWRIGSTQLLQAIGYDAPAPEELAAISNAWRGVSWRARDPVRFFAAASRIRDPQSSPLRRSARQFVRGFAVAYFFLLLRFVRSAGLDPDPHHFADQFLCFENRLASADGAFMGGPEPDACDLLLFGMVQCHCSMPTPAFHALQNDPRLGRMRAWIGSMQSRLSGYAHCYSGAYFKPAVRTPLPAGPMERAAFWAGLTLTVVLSPVTVPLIFFLAWRVPRSSNTAQ